MVTNWDLQLIYVLIVVFGTVKPIDYSGNSKLLKQLYPPKSIEATCNV